MSPDWNTAEIGALFQLGRTPCLPARSPSKTFAHHSLPALDALGGPALELGVQIESNKTLVDRPAVLVSKLNPRISRVSVVESVPPPAIHCASTEFMVLEPRSSAAHDLRYWGALFASPGFQQRMCAVATGTTNSHVRVRPPEVLRWSVSVPPLPEQRAIAAVLDTLDGAIQKTEQIIAKLQQVKQGLRHDLLTRGIDDNGELRDGERHPEQFQDSRVGTIPRSWRVKPLGECFFLQRGYDITVAEQRPGEIPVVSSSGVTSFHDTAMVNAPGVVTGRKGNLGSAYFIDQPFWPHDTALWVKHFFGNDPAFACLFLDSFRLERFDAATSVPTLNRNSIHPIPIAIPPPHEQRLITTRLRAVELRVAEETSLASKWRALQNGLAADLLTGRVRTTSLIESLS